MARYPVNTRGKHGIKFKGKRTTWSKLAAARTAYAKHKRARTPRFAIRTAPSSAPNVHMFKRSYTHPLSIGVADHGNEVYLNSDDTYMIVKLHTKLSKLPAYGEFKDLFSEYKITSICHKLTPYYKENMPFARGTTASGDFQQAIPNYEVFTIPTTSSAQQQLFVDMNGTVIEDWLLQTQRKSKRIMPSGQQTYWTTTPMVSGYKGPIDKDGGTALQIMERPSWLATTSVPLVDGGVNQTDVTHYSRTLLVRRVDGLPLNDHQAGSNIFSQMGFRVTADVFLKMRKVQ